MLLAFGCSKDHDAPTFALYDGVEKPTDVTATYDKDTDSVVVSWTMDETQDIIKYYVTVSDSSLFDFGDKITQPTDGTTTSFTLKANFISADIDSAIRYFDVSAVYHNDSTFVNLIGPRSDEPDSAMILRK